MFGKVQAADRSSCCRQLEEARRDPSFLMELWPMSSLWSSLQLSSPSSSAGETSCGHHCHFVHRYHHRSSTSSSGLLHLRGPSSAGLSLPSSHLSPRMRPYQALLLMVIVTSDVAVAPASSSSTSFHFISCLCSLAANRKIGPNQSTAALPMMHRWSGCPWMGQT